MGYSTEFFGKINLSRKLSTQELEILHTVSEYQERNLDKHELSNLFNDKVPPQSYCQWVVGSNNMSIVWDGGEKFYNYVQWMQFIIKTYLIPWKIVANGTIAWKGEEEEDIGKIHVKDNILSVDEWYQ